MRRGHLRLSSGLLCAITSAVVRRAPGAWVLPVDVPGPDRKVFEALKAALHGPVAVAVPRYHSRGGHPVLLSASFIQALTAIPPHARKPAWMYKCIGWLLRRGYMCR